MKKLITIHVLAMILGILEVACVPAVDAQVTASSLQDAKGNTAQNRVDAMGNRPLASASGVVYANPRTTGTTTAGINEAFDSFGASSACGTVYAPKGNFTITDTIGGSHINGRKGCRLLGHGSGDAASASATYLTWGGGSGGTMLDIPNCTQCETSDFVLDGGKLAGVAEWIDTASSQTLIHNVSIFHLAKDGIAEQMGVSSGIVPGETHWSDMNIQGAGTCWYVFGNGTADGRIDGSNVCAPTQYGIHVGQYSSLTSQGVTYSSFGGGPITLFQLDAGSYFLIVDKSYGEEFTNIFNVVGTHNTNGPNLTILHSGFNSQSSTAGISIGSFTANGNLLIEDSGFAPSFSGAHLDFAPLGTRGFGHYGTMILDMVRFGNVTVSNAGVKGGNGDIISRATFGGPTGSMTWYPSACQTCGSSNDISDGHNTQYLDGAGPNYTDGTNVFGTRLTSDRGNDQLGWYYNGALLGGWNLRNAPTHSAWSAFDFVTFDGYKSGNGHTLLPASADSYRGDPHGGALLCGGGGRAKQYCDPTGAWNSTNQEAMTGAIGGSPLAAGQCARGTAILSTPATGHTGIAAPSDGSNVQSSGNGVYTTPQVTVSGTTATVEICAIIGGTPTSKTYNVTVF
ncbi:MAG TPA: hypothetical protein VKR52_09035 [Terracidiphilus sp.]|nr:hypothetical protein [Terracidiphilus sp.]